MRRFGTSITALEINGITKSLDYICNKKEIDKEKIAMMGLSYGGYFTLYTMATDTRIKAGYSAGVFNDIDIYNRHDWAYPSSALQFQMAEVAALCAPRKLYVQVGMSDTVLDYHSAITEAERVKDYFEAFGVADHFKFNVWEGGHTISDHDEGYEFIINQKFIDKERVYVMGSSMGGYATWQLAMARPEWFAAIVPICGGGIYAFAERLLHMGVWAFHGSEDTVVYPEESCKMVDSINKRGGNAKLTVYEGVAHNVWNPTLENDDMWDWLFTQKNQYMTTKSEYDDVDRFG